MKVVREDLGEYVPVRRAPGVGAWRWEKPLQLRSETGVLRVGHWGTGSAFSNNQSQTNTVIIKGDTVVFVDLGAKTPPKMAEFGLSVHDVRNLIVTHSHADHIGGLEELGLKCRYEAPVRRALGEGLQFPDPAIFQRIKEIRESGETRVNLFVPHEYAPDLWSQSLAGGMAHSEEIDLGGPRGRMQVGHFFNVQPPKKIHRYDRDAWEMVVGEGEDQIHILLYVTPHIPDVAESLDAHFFSTGLVIDGRVLLSGDTQFDPDLFPSFGVGIETYFQDCQSFKGGVHAPYDDLKTLPADVKERMFLYHCDDGMRPLLEDGTLGGRDVTEDGFLGYAEPAPTFYEWD